MRDGYYVSEATDYMLLLCQITKTLYKFLDCQITLARSVVTNGID